MKKGRKQGSITVFLSMILLILLSVAVQVLGETMHQADRVKLVSSMNLSLQSTLSEYDLELLEEYGLFFLSATQEEALTRLDYYLYRNLENTGGMVQMKLEEDEIQSLELATDHKGMAYFRQAVEAESLCIAKQAIQQAKELLENYKQGEDSHKTLDNNQITKEQLQVPEDLEVDEEAKKQAENVVNPVDVITAIKENGILGLLTYDMTLSGNTILLENTLQKRKLKQGSYQRSYQNSASDEILFQLYLKDNFTNFRQDAGEYSKAQGLRYQQEYIIAGKESDKKNLDKIVEKILWIREGVNFVYLLSDGTKVAEADALAMALVGYTGLAPLIVATKLAILAVWAYGESLLEARVLLQGGRVEFIKSAENWHLSLGQLANVAEMLRGNVSGDKRGMNYEDYLFVFMNTTSKEDRCYRSMDMIEQQMQLRYNKNAFRMDNCVFYIKAMASAESRKGNTITVIKGMGY